MQRVFQLGFFALISAFSLQAETQSPAGAADPFMDLYIQEQQTPNSGSAAAPSTDINALISALTSGGVQGVGQGAVGAILAQCSAICEKFAASDKSCYPKCVTPGIRQVMQKQQQISQEQSDLRQRNQTLEMLVASAPDQSHPLIQVIRQVQQQNAAQIDELTALLSK